MNKINKVTGSVQAGHMDFMIVLAEDKDAALIRDLLVETATWMNAAGIEQWHPQQFTEELIQRYLREREIFLCMDGDVPAGMFTLQSSDPDYWGELNDESFHYLHRLLVRASYRGIGLSKALIYWAARYSREQGKQGLRFDCWDQNRKLNPYYESLGMVPQGKGTIGERGYILYQMAPDVYRSV